MLAQKDGLFNFIFNIESLLTLTQVCKPPLSHSDSLESDFLTLRVKNLQMYYDIILKKNCIMINNIFLQNIQ